MKYLDFLYLLFWISLIYLIILSSRLHSQEKILPSMAVSETVYSSDEEETRLMADKFDLHTSLLGNVDNGKVSLFSNYF